MAGFFGIMIGSIFDPISLIGYVLAGLCVRRLWLAVLLAILWRVGLHALVDAPSRFLLPALGGATTVTVAVFWVRSMLTGSPEPK